MLVRGPRHADGRVRTDGRAFHAAFHPTTATEAWAAAHSSATQSLSHKLHLRRRAEGEPLDAARALVPAAAAQPVWPRAQLECRRAALRLRDRRLGWHVVGAAAATQRRNGKSKIVHANAKILCVVYFYNISNTLKKQLLTCKTRKNQHSKIQKPK